MRSKKALFIVFVLLGFLIGALFFLRPDKNLFPFLFNPKSTISTQDPITPKDVVVTCTPGDKACNERNTKIMMNTIPGGAIDMAKHQCDGPRACPIPDSAQTSEFESAIRSSANDPNLTLIRVTGITPQGIIYYCATNGRCWKYDTMKNNIVEIKDQFNPKSSGSADVDIK